MKLISKEMCPTTVRDRLIKNLASQDVAVCDLVRAVKWAEEKCLELDEEKRDCLERIIAAIEKLKKPSHGHFPDKEEFENGIYDVVISLIKTQLHNQ